MVQPTGGHSDGSDDEDCGDDTGNMGRIEEPDHVTMSFTADVSDMDEEQVEMLQTLADTYERAFEEVVAKNRDYDFSFLKEAEKLSQSDSYPIDHPTRAQVDGLLHRTGDKRERVMENVYGNGDATVSDEPHITAMECANYWFFVSFVLEHSDLTTHAPTR